MKSAVTRASAGSTVSSASFEVVVVISVSRRDSRPLRHVPRLKCILDSRERRPELRKMTPQDTQHRVLLEVVQAELGIDLRAVVVGIEPVALQAARCHEQEDTEGGLAEPETLGQRLGVETGHQVHAL